MILSFQRICCKQNNFDAANSRHPKNICWKLFNELLSTWGYHKRRFLSISWTEKIRKSFYVYVIKWGLDGDNERMKTFLLGASFCCLARPVAHNHIPFHNLDIAENNETNMSNPFWLMGTFAVNVAFIRRLSQRITFPFHMTKDFTNTPTKMFLIFSFSLLGKVFLGKVMKSCPR